VNIGLCHDHIFRDLRQLSMTDFLSGRQDRVPE